MKELTKRQGEILTFIHAYLDKTGGMPTLSEIAKAFDFTEKAAWDVVGALIKKGKLEKGEKGEHRGIRLTNEERGRRENNAIPIYMGKLTPSKLLSHTPELIYTPKGSMRDGTYFAIKVESFSMKNAGILPGDICILQREIDNLKDNDIVLATASDSDDAELELRRFRRTPYFSELWPENDSMGIIKASSFRVLGILKGLTRRY